MDRFGFLFPDVTWDVSSIVSSNAALANHGVYNLIFGSSQLMFITSGNVTTNEIRFDFGSGNEKAISFLFLRGIIHLASLTGGIANLGIQLRSSDNNFSSSTVRAEASPVTSLTGLKDEDFLLESSYTGTHRYWAVRTTTTASVQHQFRKLYLGELFDFDGRSPSYPYTPGYVATSQPFVSDKGAQFKSSQAKPQRVYNIQLQAISEATRNEFEERIIRVKDDAPIVVFYEGEHNLLSGKKTACCWIREVEQVSSDQWKGFNNIQMLLVEDIV